MEVIIKVQGSRTITFWKGEDENFSRANFFFYQCRCLCKQLFFRYYPPAENFLFAMFANQQNLITAIIDGCNIALVEWNSPSHIARNNSEGGHALQFSPCVQCYTVLPNKVEAFPYYKRKLFSRPLMLFYSLYYVVQTPGGGDSHMKWTGMLVVSLRGVNLGFWSRLGCSGQNVSFRSRLGLHAKK